MAEVAADTVLGFAPHARLQFDRVRERWCVLAPERIFVPDEVALEVLKLIDGSASVGAIAETLRRAYAASTEDILADLLPLLQDLRDKGVLQ